MKIVVPIAGRGSRFLNEQDQNPEYRKPKPIINIAGHEMVKWALESLPIQPEDEIIFLHSHAFGLIYQLITRLKGNNNNRAAIAMRVGKTGLRLNNPPGI